jgi:hypothetical protein
VSSNGDKMPIEELVVKAIEQERRRCVGLVLNAYGIYKLSGELNICKALDVLATAMERSDPEARHDD